MVVTMTTAYSIWLLAVPFDIWLFHLTFGCSIRHLAVPFDIWLFHSTFGCSIRHLAVPFDIWLFHFSFGCSIRHLADPFDDYPRVAVPCHVTLFCLEFGCFIRSFIAVSLYDRLFYFSLGHSNWCAAVSFEIMLVYSMSSLDYFSCFVLRACRYAELFEICLFRFACVAIASLFEFNLNHLTNTYAISSRMAWQNRCSL